MLATPQPEPPNLGGQQERELPSTGLFWLPPPLPHLLLCPGKCGKTSCSSEPPWACWEGMFHRHQRHVRVQVHLKHGDGAASAMGWKAQSLASQQQIPLFQLI